MNTKININDFNYNDFDLDEFLNSNPSFDDVRELMETLLCVLYDCNDHERYLEDELGIKIVAFEKRSNVENDLERVSHLVLNNAMYIISKGAEKEFAYQLTEKDRNNYRFKMGELKYLDKIAYGGYEGTIDFVFDNGEAFQDDDFDCQDMEMVASYMYDVVAMGREDRH